ncbi:MAG: hypothetical protein EPO28_12020 [Saprospiraceae bacterium]|nr:MAG: hypothetical protein EPO28_12020 [Saprospiraceae bacterium]
MDMHSLSPIFTTPASLWDGIRQLPGTLELWGQEVVFRFANFKDSHLDLVIPISEIEIAEEYLVFDLARNGLRIESKGGRYDLFVLEDVPRFKHALAKELARLDSKS